MYRNKKSSLISCFAALIIVSGLSVCACSQKAHVTDESLPDLSTQVSESVNTEPAAQTELPETSETSEPRDTSASSSVSSETTEESSKNVSGPDIDTLVLTETDIGTGSYGFQKGKVRFHTQNDISMLIEPEDTTIYDYGARSISCYWIDVFYMEDSFDMAAFDYSYRFLSFYNDDTSISFSG